MGKKKISVIEYAVKTKTNLIITHESVLYPL